MDVVGGVRRRPRLSQTGLGACEFCALRCVLVVQCAQCGLVLECRVSVDRCFVALFRVGDLCQSRPPLNV